MTHTFPPNAYTYSHPQQVSHLKRHNSKEVFKHNCEEPCSLTPRARASKVHQEYERKRRKNENSENNERTRKHEHLLYERDENEDVFIRFWKYWINWLHISTWVRNLQWALHKNHKKWSRKEILEHGQVHVKNNENTLLKTIMKTVFPHELAKIITDRKQLQLLNVSFLAR